MILNHIKEELEVLSNEVVDIYQCITQHIGSGKTNIDGLYAIGDCSSHTRVNIQSASMGILCAKDIVNS